MIRFKKGLLRLAAAIQAELAAQQCQCGRLELPAWTWDRCRAIARRVHRAQQRGWQLAAKALRRELAQSLPTLESEISALVAQVPRTTNCRSMATVREVYQDLLALEMEFDDLAYDVHGHWLSLTTEPITLHDVYLGPFEIRLDWRRTGSDAAYRVIAKEPHPPDSRANVTHPHVLDEILCEGHSRQAIRESLRQGRLLDFLTLIANGLRSYNPESPYVALEVWYGATCTDCGAVVDEDDGYSCQRCEETLCEGCERSCSCCGDSCCSRCISTCDLCDEHCCRGCVKACSGCRQRVCPGCLGTVTLEPQLALGRTLARAMLHYPVGTVVYHALAEEARRAQLLTLTVHDERCTSCHETQSELETEQPAATEHKTTVQPHGLGQTVVPA